MVQVQEEVAHAKILRRYLLDNDVSLKMTAIAEPDKTFSTDLEPLEAGLAHEKHITACIDRCYAAANDVHDFRAMQMLDWFVKEQGEEETNASDMIKNMKLFGSDPKGLYDLGPRVPDACLRRPDDADVEHLCSKLAKKDSLA